MALKEKAQVFAVKKALEYMDRDPKVYIPKLVDWLERFDGQGTLTEQIRAVKGIMNDPDSNWYKLILSLWQDIDRGVRNRLFENFIINASLLGYQKQEENREKYNCNIPWAILMDPTSACNLHCTGCWAAEYGNHMNLSYEELAGIVNQGTELGTYVYLFTGGEPLVRRKDLIRLCEAHPDCVFSSFTNGTLIDEEFADEMLRVKNFVPAISIEGFEEATDSRRVKGTYGKIIRAMELLKKRKLPVGKGAVTELMATAEQREMMYRKIREYRNTKPLFTVDFWNDGEYVGGCIAGGRSYCHINANGDIEPCAFMHYSDSNIREKTLLEAYCSGLFMGHHDNQPFHKNMLRPCPVLDNPGRLTKLVEESGAKSTDYQNPESAKEFFDKCVATAENWEPVADRLWRESGKK